MCTWANQAASSPLAGVVSGRLTQEVFVGVPGCVVASCVKSISKSPFRCMSISQGAIHADMQRQVPARISHDTCLTVSMHGLRYTGIDSSGSRF